MAVGPLVSKLTKQKCKKIFFTAFCSLKSLLEAAGAGLGPRKPKPPQQRARQDGETL